MGMMSWHSIGEQLRAIGVVLPVEDPAADNLASVRPLRESRSPEPETPPVKPSIDEISEAEAVDSPQGAEVFNVIKFAVAAGVTFFQRVTDGELIENGMQGLQPALLNTVKSMRREIRSALLPEHTTQSLELLGNLGAELTFIQTEAQASAEITRLCAATNTLGLDVETAPRPEFLPIQWPIAITKDGRRSKTQAAMDTSAALDPFRAEVRLLQVAADIAGRSVALVIDLRHVPLCSPALAPLWQKKLVGHNLSFDAKMLMANRIKLAGDNLVDTILMSGLVLRGEADKRRPGSRRPSLATAVQEALNIDLPKTAQLSPWWHDRLTDEQIAYAALDAVISLRLATALQPRIENLVSGREALNRLNKAVNPVARMELAGVALDRDGLAKQAQAWDEELTVLRTKIAALGIVNPSSAPQVASWLSSKLEMLDTTTGSQWVSLWPRTDTGAMSTKAKHIRRLSNHLPEADLLVRFSSVAQLVSNFGDKLLQRVSPHTGRLHGNFLIAMAKSGRFSSSGPNLQNIPKSTAMRSVFVASPGRMLVVADYSQLELRVMAAIAQDRTMTEAYRSGLDLHAVTAAGMLGIDPCEFASDNLSHKEARQKAKAVNFGVIYGSGPEGLQEFARDAYGIQMNLKEAQGVINRFLETYPGVARWQRAQADKSARTKCVATVGGRVYHFGWEANGYYVRNLALNLPVQGTAAEIAIEALIRIDARLQAELGDRARLVLQIHDEFVVEVDQEHQAVELVKQILEEEMTTAFSILLPAAPTTGLVDAHAGLNWAAAKI
jgi:DNA polymerase I